uniref:Ig-like domain-containing protein n=1 Tax=Oryzias latipes TaxID=8090 RepID=A0A3B3H854_ORYLA
MRQCAVRVSVAVFGFLSAAFVSGLGVHGEDMPPHIVHQPSDVVVKVGNPATLSCRADGSPKPTIQWLRNGQPLRTREGDGQLQPMVLSDGNLFFLSVGGARRGSPHEGVYSCVASNSAGKAVSRNASLHIAGKTLLCAGLMLSL